MNKIYTYNGLNELAQYIPKNSGVFVIIDNNLKQYYKYFNMFNIIEIETCENTKTLNTVQIIIEQLLEIGADRDCFIMGVGGGITTDITGYVASIYKRGVKFGFVPTTLLAQVDASIGGKNGVNFHSYKNIIGTITQPQWIYECTSVLMTLNPKEFKAGIAEILKTFILFDATYYNKAVAYFTELEEYLKENKSYLMVTNKKSTPNKIYKQEILTSIIEKCAKYKCGVVERDEFEKGERRLLNLGHTFAHAIEKLCGEQDNRENKGHIKISSDAKFAIMHGEAVSIGMVIAAKIAEKLSPGSSNFSVQLKADLINVGLPVKIPTNFSIHDLIQAIGKDKKVAGENIHFILPKGVGNVEDKSIPLNQLKEISSDLC
ncbi:MAG: 3-dehydroquinate synthase family protein [Bacteroidales bacterium]